MNRIVKAVSAILLALSVFVSAACSSLPKYRSNDNTAVMKIGDTIISADMYRYYYSSFKSESDGKSEDELKKIVEDNLRDIVAVIQTAKEYKMSLPDEDVADINDSIAQIKASYESDEEYLADLDKHFLSEQVLYEVMYNDSLNSLLYAYMTDEKSMIINSSDSDFEKCVNEEFLAAVNIVITDDTADPDNEELKGKELAQSILQRIRNGESIYELAEKYSVDSYTKDRYFAPLTTLDFFEEKVRALEIGEVSEVYSSELGWCITKRVAIDNDYVSENYDELKDNYKYYQYLKIMTEKSKSYKVEYTEDFDSVKQFWNTVA